MRLVTPKYIVQPLDFTRSSDLPQSTGMKQGYYIAYHLVVGDYQAFIWLDKNKYYMTNENVHYSGTPAINTLRFLVSVRLSVTDVGVVIL